MDEDSDQNLPPDLLSYLIYKYSEITDNQIVDTEALQDALNLIPHCKVYICERSITKYYDLFLRLAKHSDYPSRIVAPIEENIRSGDADQYLPNLNLLLILQIKWGIYEMLDDGTISHISNISESSPLEEYIRAKRDRDGLIILRESYSSLVEYLACISLRLFSSPSSEEVDFLSKKVWNTLIGILGDDEKVDSTTEYPMLYLKTFVNLIRCISLFIERDYLECFKTELLEKTLEALNPLFKNEEISEAWLELLSQIGMKNPRSILVSYLPDALINTLHVGSDWIKNTFLNLIKVADVKIFRNYLSRFDEVQNNSAAFREKVFMIGIMKLHSQRDKNIKDIIQNYRCLLKVDDFSSLPDYCYEMLIILHKRSLIEEMNEIMNHFITNFNRRLYTEIENMNVQCLRRAGEYISLLPQKPESKNLAKKWIEIVIRPEILNIQSEDIFCLYIRILVLAYIPEEHDHIETSISHLNNLGEQLKAIMINYFDPEEMHWMNYVARLYNIGKDSIPKLRSSIGITDDNYHSCKTLFNNFSVFLQEVAAKLPRIQRLDLKLTVVESKNLNEKTLKKTLTRLIDYLKIEDKSIVEEFINRNIPSILQYVDIEDLFNPQTVYQFFESMLLWNGLAKIVEYAVKYYNKKNRNSKTSILEDMMKWSSNLTSLARSNYFKYLNCPGLNDTTKAYIMQQIFLCSVNRINSISVLYSSIMKFILIEPTNAIDYDTTLRYVIKQKFLQLVANIRGTILDRSISEYLARRIFYGPLDSSTDGETIYGGYIILNQKYKANDDISKASAKITLAHELAHLISRLEDHKYKYLTVSPQKRVRFQSAGADSSFNNKIEAGEHLETQLFGFKVKYISHKTVEFLNSMDTWTYDLKKFKQEFKRCLHDNSGYMISLKRYTPSERDSNGKECVLRFGVCLSEPEIKACEDTS